MSRRTFQLVVNLVRNSMEKRDNLFREAVSTVASQWHCGVLPAGMRTELLPPSLELESLLLSRSQTVLLTP